MNSNKFLWIMKEMFHWQLRVVQQGPLESWKIETSFLLDKQWQSTTYHSWHGISNCPTKKVLAMQWDTHEAYKCWCSSTSIEQSMSVLQKCLFCSVIARSQSCSWNPMGTKRGSPKVWKSDISCLMAILQMTREHFIFNAWKMTAVLE